MVFFSFFFILFTVFSTAFAKVGDTCRAEGVKGTCQEIKTCSTGITVKGACPNDPDGVRCCIKKSCQDGGKKQGMCFDKRNNGCSGGHFITGACPGDTNMQCCIKNANQPSCPGARNVPINNFPDDIVFSRGGTKKAAAAFKGASKVLDVCEIVGLAIPGPGEVVGIACGVASLGTEFIGDHADECAKKNQCLKLKAYSVPFCIGNNDGCCG